MSHAARINLFTLAPSALKAMINLSQTVKQGALGPRLVELVNLRVSQQNGCGVCVDMHWRDLVKQGADPRHLNSVAAWRESPFFSERERAALDWAETLTRLPGHHEARDAEFEALQAHFSELEIVELSIAIAQINAWNRMGVGMRLPVAAKALP